MLGTSVTWDNLMWGKPIWGNHSGTTGAISEPLAATWTLAVAPANLLLAFVGLYAFVGLVFGVLFVLRGAGALDAGARGGSLGFRILVLPGAAALWPWLLLRWRGMSGWQGKGPAPHRMSDEPARRRTGDARTWQATAWWFAAPIVIVLAWLAVRGVAETPPVPAATFAPMEVKP
ncbi:MAG: hypothetical protein AB8G96_01940 [Phycisphaerales bacterium]